MLRRPHNGHGWGNHLALQLRKCVSKPAVKRSGVVTRVDGQRLSGPLLETSTPTAACGRGRQTRSPRTELCRWHRHSPTSEAREPKRAAPGGKFDKHRRNKFRAVRVPPLFDADIPRPQAGSGRKKPRLRVHNGGRRSDTSSAKAEGERTKKRRAGRGRTKAAGDDGCVRGCGDDDVSTLPRCLPTLPARSSARSGP